MSLNTEIRETIHNIRENFPSELSALIEQGAGEISALEIVEKALKEGDKAPEFDLLDRSGDSHQLSDYLSSGPVVLTFYRGVWCPYCNLQLAAYNANLSEIESLGAQLIAVTPEKPEGPEVFKASDVPQEVKDSIMDDPDFDVLHDAESKLAEKYGLVFELPDSHKKLFEMMNFDVEKATGDSSFTFSDPATFIVGTDGLIKWAYVPNNYRKRAEPELILEQLKKLN